MGRGVKGSQQRFGIGKIAEHRAGQINRVRLGEKDVLDLLALDGDGIDHITGSHLDSKHLRARSGFSRNAVYLTLKLGNSVGKNLGGGIPQFGDVCFRQVIGVHTVVRFHNDVNVGSFGLIGPQGGLALHRRKSFRRRKGIASRIAVFRSKGGDGQHKSQQKDRRSFTNRLHNRFLIPWRIPQFVDYFLFYTKEGCACNCFLQN